MQSSPLKMFMFLLEQIRLDLSVNFTRTNIPDYLFRSELWKTERHGNVSCVERLYLRCKFSVTSLSTNHVVRFLLLNKQTNKQYLINYFKYTALHTKYVPLHSDNVSAKRINEEWPSPGVGIGIVGNTVATTTFLIEVDFLEAAG